VLERISYPEAAVLFNSGKCLYTAVRLGHFSSRWFFFGDISGLSECSQKLVNLVQGGPGSTQVVPYYSSRHEVHRVQHSSAFCFPKMTKAFVALLALLASQCVSAWTPHVTSRGRVLRLQAENSVDRRSWIAAAATAVVAAPNFAYAETAQPELSEEEVQSCS
jgi:hypothetical protein